MNLKQSYTTAGIIFLYLAMHDYLVMSWKGDLSAAVVFLVVAFILSLIEDKK